MKQSKRMLAVAFLVVGLSACATTPDVEDPTDGTLDDTVTTMDDTGVTMSDMSTTSTTASN